MKSIEIKVEGISGDILNKVSLSPEQITKLTTFYPKSCEYLFLYKCNFIQT